MLLILIPSILCFFFIITSNKNKKELENLKNQRLVLPNVKNTMLLSVVNEYDKFEVPNYQSLYKDLYVGYPKKFREDNKKTVYLTFDDGPSPRTDEVLEILKQNDIKATFFIIGNQLKKQENIERLKMIAQEGHSIGIHTYSHNYVQIYNSVEDYLNDFYKAWSEVKEITGVAPTAFRFPGGSINSYNGHIYQEIISEMTRRGFVYFDWNVSAEDAGAKSTMQSITTSAVNSRKYQRVILLMHDSDSKFNTVKALPEIINHYKMNEYEFKVIDKETKPIIFGYKD